MHLSVKSVFLPGFVYFLLTFTAAFAFGCIRVPLLVPRIGTRYAELLEMPFLLYAIMLTSQYVVRHFNVGSGIGAGIFALAIELCAEVGMMYIRGDSSIASVKKQIREHDPISGSAFIAMLAVYAAMPMIRVNLGEKVEDGKRKADKK